MGTQETKAVLRRRQRRLESAPGRPRKLSREAVVAAAEAMIMRGGGTLTMRALAEALGVITSTISRQPPWTESWATSPFPISAARGGSPIS